MGDVVKSSKFVNKRVVRELMEYRNATPAPTHLCCPACACETFFVKSEVCKGDDHANILCASCGAESKPWAEQIP